MNTHIKRTEKMVISVSTKCPCCGQYTKVYVDKVDYQDFKEGEKFAQDAFPYLSSGERETLISGICPDCWNKIFKDEEE
jgi:hypothetical protein